ncbi:MAG: hypothetical protein CISAcid_07570 [uncultured Acidilobus sp. CIS]|nr:MAG: hypothetical protein CISAcid_07570 [uncultured Acidilobus sp. CIS]
MKYVGDLGEGANHLAGRELAVYGLHLVVAHLGAEELYELVVGPLP